MAASILYVAGFIGIRRVVGAGARAGSPSLAAAGGGTVTVDGPTWYQKAPNWAYVILTAGNIAHAGAMTLRGLGAGHWPTSNMFEFISAMGLTTMIAFQVIYRIFRLPALGALVAPLGVVILGYASVFPQDVKPLIPALQSYWLYLHVSMAALGEGFFAVAFVAAMLYLLRTRTEAESRWGAMALEGVFWLFATITAFIILAFVLRSSGFEWSFVTASGTTSLYHLPPVIGPNSATVGEHGRLLGLIPLPSLPAPLWMKAKYFNTFLWAILVGTGLYWAVRGVTGRPWRVALAAPARGLNAQLLDEISYRAVAIGYPVFTLGGLVFAMIWAKEAWGRYWFWDPKETWALIAWLTYSGYLHARITHGWEGRKSAWLAAIGFGVILFTLVGVNLLIVGLHSYAGGD